MIIAVGITIVIAGVGYVMWSKQAWEQMTATAAQWHQSVKTDVEKAVSLPTATQDERDRFTQKIVAIAQKITTDKDRICHVSSAVQWQQRVVASLKDARSACEKKVATTVEFEEKLTEVINYSKNDHALAAILAAVPQTSELADDTWEKQVTAWDEAAKAAGKLAVTAPFTPTQQLAVTHMTAVKAAWQELIAADQSKDKQKYLAAQSAMATAIDGFGDVSITSQQAFAKLADELEKVSSTTFASHD